MIGKTLSHYRIVEKIGAGGMGEAYRTRDGSAGRDLAVNVLLWCLKGRLLLLLLFASVTLAAGQAPEKRPDPKRPETLSPKDTAEVSFEQKLLGTIPQEFDYPAEAGFRIHHWRDSPRAHRLGEAADVYLAPSRVGRCGKRFCRFEFVGNRLTAGKLWGQALWVAFNRTGTQAAYLASQRGKVFFVVGNKKGPEFDEIGLPFLSPDGQTVGYIAVERGPLKPRTFIVVGNKKVPLEEKEVIEISWRPVWRKLFGIPSIYEAGAITTRWRPLFSPDSRRVAYKRKLRGKHAIVVLEGPWEEPGELAATSGPDFDQVGLPVFSPNGSTLAYAAKRGGKWFLVVGDKHGPRFDQVAHPVFSPDGSALAYAAKRGGKWFLVVGEKHGPEFYKVWRPHFSPDSRTVAYAATITEVWLFSVRRTSRIVTVVVGGKPGPEFVAVDHPVFSPDGSLVAYAAKKDHADEKWFLVVGDKRGPELDGVWSPVFSPDGSKVAYGALQGRGLWWKVMEVRKEKGEVVLLASYAETQRRVPPETPGAKTTVTESERQAMVAAAKALKAADLPALRQKAESGDPHAQYILGLAYAHAYGVERDPAHAIVWFRKSAEQGYPPGQNGLGVGYMAGDGVQKNEAEGIKWLRQAAEQNYAQGQSNLGLAYVTGRAVPKDAAVAVKWFRQAAAQGNPYGEYRLGVCYLVGEGVPQDEAQGLKWVRQAAEQDAPGVHHGMAHLYDDGLGVRKDHAEAARWYRKAADEGHPEAQFDLGVAYWNGEGVRRDPYEAMAWFRKAAEQGDAVASYHLGLAERKWWPWHSRNREAARLWFQRAAEQGFPMAAFELGKIYAKGKEVPRDYAAAYTWFLIAYELDKRDDWADSRPHETTEMRKKLPGDTAKARKKLTAKQAAESEERTFEWLKAHLQ